MASSFTWPIANATYGNCPAKRQANSPRVTRSPASLSEASRSSPSTKATLRDLRRRDPNCRKQGPLNLIPLPASFFNCPLAFGPPTMLVWMYCIYVHMAPCHDSPDVARVQPRGPRRTRHGQQTTMDGHKMDTTTLACVRRNPVSRPDFPDSRRKLERTKRPTCVPQNVLFHARNNHTQQTTLSSPLPRLSIEQLEHLERL